MTQLYAFVGVFVAFGLVLFLPTRGDFRRPDELEASTYDDDRSPPAPGDRPAPGDPPEKTGPD